MPMNSKELQKDLEAYQDSFTGKEDPFEVALNYQLKLDKYRIDEEARAKALREEVRDSTVLSAFVFGILLGVLITYKVIV